MTDEAKALVERLRELLEKFEGQGGRAYTSALFSECADHIETQAREIERLRDALKKYDRLKSGIVGARSALAGDSHDQ